MLKSIQFKPTPKEKLTNNLFRAGILKPKMNFTDTDRLKEKAGATKWQMDGQIYRQVVHGQINHQVSDEVYRQFRTLTQFTINYKISRMLNK